MEPNGWSKFNLGDILSFKNGINAEKKHYGHGVKFVNVMDVFRDTRLYEQSIIGLVSISDKQLKEFSVQYGDILFNRTSETFEEIAFASVYLDTKTITFGGFVIRGRPRGEFLHPEYSVYCFQASKIRRQLISKGQGAVRANIGQKDLNKVLLSLPPIPEQQKIAKILSTWDKAITTTEALIDNSKQQKKALMQQLLTGKKRFAGFEGGWEEVSLGDVSDMNSGGTPKSSIEEYYGGDIPWVSIADMTKHGKWIQRTEKHLSKLGLESSSARLFPKGTVLYAMYASIGECSISTVELASSQAILGIRPKASLSNLYLYYVLKMLKEKVILMGQQGTQSNLNAAMVKDFKLFLPILKEQQKIVTVLTNADKEVELLEQQLTDLKQEKSALMQQLLTGKCRVKIDEI